ncbi:MAG: trypsin-like peptidase domain-containing protein [Verrucomicrobia bacterium]|nr:trypsin-like peptidase domain-containing protein [Verrucomicrobiota bacterium]
MKKILFNLVIMLFVIANSPFAQVSTNFNNDNIISAKGRFERNYVTAIDFIVPSKNIDSLISQEKREIAQSSELKPFKLADPTKVNLDILKLTTWTYDKEFAYGKFTLKLSGALSSSINFDKFYLPKNTELFVYNENGRMITGPITERENNKDGIWGSWVYQGELLTIEIKTPIASMKELILHSDNVAYGYKEIYKSIKVGGFGTSGPCNINVICPLGNGWEGERNSVSTILSANGGEFCTGSLVMNTCGTNIPYYLTANHCFEQGNSNVPGWRFAFQAWSTTCPNPGVNTNGVMYNGATLRARNAPSDFCLVELNQTPPANSGLHYGGWNRSATPAQNATGIHHPSGDLMKISRANNPVTVASFAGTTNQHWRANWSPQNNGSGEIVTPVTEGGSSGSPLYDQNHRIIGQLHGGPSFCNGTQLWDFYGRFDLSWTGGGTNSTRLSNWLDPNNSGATTTTTTNIVNLALPQLSLSITGGSNQICTGSSTYTLNGAPTGANIFWSISNTSIATLSSNGNQATVTKTGNGDLTLTASVGNASPCYPNSSAKTIKLGTYLNYEVQISGFTMVPLNYTSSYSVDLNKYPITNLVWSWPSPPTYNPPFAWSYVYGGNENYYIVLRSGSAASTGDVGLSFSSCGVNNILASKWVAWGYGGPMYRISPNPANVILKIEQIDSTTNKALTQTNIQLIEIIDKMGIVVYRQAYSKVTTNGITISVAGLRNDIYTVRIFDGELWKSYKVSVQH